MQVYLFRASGRVFGVTGVDDPSKLPADYGPWTAFKAMEFERGVATPGIDVDACLDDIEKHGFHLTDAHVRITDKHV